MAAIMYGKGIAEMIKKSVEVTIEKLEAEPKLAIITIGNSDAADVYNRGKHKDCNECGIKYRDIIMPETIDTDGVIHRIKYLRNRYDGVILNTPIPKHLNYAKIAESIDVKQDVDGVTPSNIGKLLLNTDGLVPCTPMAVIYMLEYYGIKIEGKKCVVIGRSNIVGKPMALMMTHKNATVTLCHTKTEGLSDITKEADILISAAGVANLVTSDMVKDGAVVIDIGINRNSDGAVVGDVDFENVKEKASFITPVPGGVGVVTRAVLMENIMKAHMRRLEK